MPYYDRIDVSEAIGVNPKSVIFVTVGIFWTKVLSFKHMFAIDVMIYYWCLWTLAILLFQRLKRLTVVLLVELTKVELQAYPKY